MYLRAREIALLTSLALALCAACSPRTIAEAERRGELGRLDAEGSGQAVAGAWPSGRQGVHAPSR